MQTPAFRSALFALIGLILSPPLAHAASPPADSVHLCTPFDYEQWRRDHPRPAAKQLANLNVGEPRTVRIIYFLPNDLPVRQEAIDAMKVMIRQIQTFYAEQMQAHGYGNTTFRFETDAQDEPLVHHVVGRHRAGYYQKVDYRTRNVTGTVIEEIERTFNLEANIYFIGVDNGIGAIGGGGGRAFGGVGSRWGKSGGFALAPIETPFDTRAHELGHAFGLWHDFHDGAYIMSYGPGRDQLSACHAEFLAVHPYFNPNSSVAFRKSSLPTAELTSPRAYPVGSASVPVQLKVGGSQGLHQVLLFGRTRRPHFAAGFLEVKACRGLAGEKKADVEFEYDGTLPSSDFSSLSKPFVHPLRVKAVDAKGDETATGFMLAEISPYQIATLEGHREGVNSVAFSPDGTLLASGSGDGTAKLWDTGTQKEVATFRLGRNFWVASVAFSPIEGILAAASRGLGLWDVATKQRIAILRGEDQSYSYSSVAFSPDGTLAMGLWNGMVELWSVRTRRNIATLEGHREGVNSVVFSVDGTLLASGSGDGTIRLWDVASRQSIATLKANAGYRVWIYSVSFSPDGKTLAAGLGDRTIKLWDVASRRNIATLEDHASWVEAVSFSVDGTLLASGSGDGTIRLWDVASKQNITAFGNTSEVRSVSFSPDEVTLASGSRDGTVALWDVSEWTESSEPGITADAEQEIPVGEQARPQTLTKVSGDNQQGLAGEQLAKPFVVSVLDEDGKAIARVAVTFSVTAGGGTLSAATVTTGANGRARSTLTLGPDPGTNTVVATVAGLEPETFTATASEQTPHSLEKVSGEGQEGPASAQLAAPFVVSVLDQDGSPLAGVDVTFSVTAGGGMLSSTTDTNPCTIESSTSSTTATTDANGRAATRLTLGSDAGTNTVAATVAELAPETFTATATEQAMPHSLTKVCGDSQEGTTDILLNEPFVVSVSDEDGAAIAGVVVSFAVTAGGGTLSATTSTTDANGRAATRLTLGSQPGTNTVTATVEGLEPVTFTAVGQESPLAGFFDSFLGGGKRVALPDSPQLAQNAPNPFNSQTVLAYFLPAPGPARVEVFTLTGQRMAVLHQGLQQAGYHRLHWDSRDDAGRPVASGLYLYRLVTEETVLTRKLVLIR